MATAGDRSINCTVCLDAFKDPRLLPCCHAFCKGCLENVLEKSDTTQKLTCPQCRQEHSITANGIDGLLPDFAIVSDVAALKASQQKPTCGECDGSDPAVAYCCECESYLCDYCTNSSHKRLKRFRGHKVIPLSSLNPEVVKPSRGPLFCPEHPDKSPVAFCMKCQILVCGDCIVLTSHERHKYGAIDTATRKEVEIKFKNQLDRSKAKLTGLKEDLEYIKGVDQQVGKYPDQLKTAINGTFDAFITTLESRRSQLLKEAETSCTADLKKVWSQKEVVERAVVGLETTLGFTERVLQCSSDGEFLSLWPQASSQLKHLRGTKWDVETVGRLEETKREFIGGNHTAYLQNIGQMREVKLSIHATVKGVSSSLPLGNEVEFMVASKSRGISEPTAKILYGYSQKEHVLDPIKTDEGKWVIPFTPFCGGHHILLVSVRGREVDGSPFKFTVEGIPSVGDHVITGPDCSDDDDLYMYDGTVEEVDIDCLLVSLDDGYTECLRWGSDGGQYDVQLDIST